MRNRPSRRDVLRGLAAAGLGLTALLGVGSCRGREQEEAEKAEKAGRTSRPAADVPGRDEGRCRQRSATVATVSTTVLTQGQRYRLRASGFWTSNATHGQDAFADFEFADP